MPSSRSILFLNHNFRGRGTFFRTFHLARILAELGWDAWLMTISPTRTVRETRDTYRGVNLIVTPQFLIPQRYAAGGFCPWSCIQRCIRIAARRLDVVVVSDHLPAVSIPFLVGRLVHPSTLFVADWADLFTSGGLHEHWNYSFRKPIYATSQMLEHGVKRKAHLCTATSRPLLRLLTTEVGVPATRALYLPSGCDLGLTFPESRDVARQIIGLPRNEMIIGRTCSSDIITEAETRAMIGLADRYRSLTGQQVTFYIIGPCDPANHPDLFNSTCRVRYTGWLKPEGLPPHLSACDAFILVEEDTPNNHYRGPIRLNDYLAAGRPVLLNSIGDHVSTLLSYGACVVCDDYATTNRTLDDVLTNEESRIKMGRSARKLAEGELSWDALGKKLEDFILSYQHLRSVNQ